MVDRISLGRPEMAAPTRVDSLVQCYPGSRFGRLEVLQEGEPYFWRGRFSRRRWVCACDCGSVAEVREDQLKSGRAISCGCARDDAHRERLFRHGARAASRATPEYLVWQSILHDAEGTPVCPQWRQMGGRGFRAFLEHMGSRPSPAHRLVLLDAGRGYGPQNCAWVAGAPRRGVPRAYLSYRGKVMTLKEAATTAGIAYATLCKRIARGWSVERALEA